MHLNQESESWELFFLARVSRSVSRDVCVVLSDGLMYSQGWQLNEQNVN